MKTKTAAIMLSTGLIAGVGALLPFSAYAAGETTPTKAVSVTVSPTISIDAANGGSVTASTGIQEGTIDVTIRSNSSYKIQLSAANPALSASGITETIPSTSSVTAGTSGWGVKKKSAANSATDATTYSQITTTPTDFYTATSGTGNGTTMSTFKFGVAVSPSLPAGTYTTNITITALTTS